MYARLSTRRQTLTNTFALSLLPPPSHSITALPYALLASHVMFKFLSSPRAGHLATSVSPSTPAQYGPSSKKKDVKKGSALTRTFKKLKQVVTRTRSTDKVSTDRKDAHISQHKNVHNSNQNTPKPAESSHPPAPRRGPVFMSQPSTAATHQRPSQTVAPASSIHATNKVGVRRDHAELYRQQGVQDRKGQTPKPGESSVLQQTRRAGPTPTDGLSNLGTSQRPPRAHARMHRYPTAATPPQRPHTRSNGPPNSDLDRRPANAPRELGLRLIPLQAPPVVDNGGGRRLTAKECLEISQREFEAEMARQRRYAKTLKREHLARTRRKAERDCALMRLVDALDPFLQEQEQLASSRELL
ncbi:glycoside hydrolase family 79 protein [Tulasnella calospora MUT 4182]|uniref:Glycoside hydrolase family 79 protein n=1 Tax=Tulasnella calospora MUT 4182 TaxID=1051891 RepID=A0A0C3PXC2_9AGAM|nr:glycoside hydrolase family 79 protein [Tulasnella calospora MUT 4182]